MRVSVARSSASSAGVWQALPPPKRGSWISYKGTQLAQGRDACKEALKGDATLYAEVEEQVKVRLVERGGVVGKRGAAPSSAADKPE